MKTTTRTALSAMILVAAVSLAGCAAPATTSSPEAEPDAPSASSDFCGEFEAAGGTGASFGGVALFYPKEDLIAGIDDALTVLAVTPPDEVAEPWGALKAHYEKARAEAEKLEAGAMLSDPALLEESGTLTDEVDVLTDYYFDNCG